MDVRPQAAAWLLAAGSVKSEIFGASFPKVGRTGAVTRPMV